eukprot:TRINITY_DN16685_c0_g1_i1.p1 TRINITY_DN16685_c0_g1~~TRINITY_DN16685_c0_g1_i1.p1  ORF type:complete len:236 (+),score=12.41 TRINITY_DN16685_c0_g1_i1:198-905(+)
MGFPNTRVILVLLLAAVAFVPCALAQTCKCVPCSYKYNLPQCRILQTIRSKQKAFSKEFVYQYVDIRNYPGSPIWISVTVSTKLNLPLRTLVQNAEKKVHTVAGGSSGYALSPALIQLIPTGGIKISFNFPNIQSPGAYANLFLDPDISIGQQTNFTRGVGWIKRTKSTQPMLSLFTAGGSWNSIWQPMLTVLARYNVANNLKSLTLADYDDVVSANKKVSQYFEMWAYIPPRRS